MAAPPPLKPVVYDHDRWGWVMVAVAFLSTFMIMGNIKGLGVLLIPITSDLDADLWLVGWIAVMYGLMQNCLGPIVGALCRLLGSRRMMVLGAVLNTLGILLTAFSPSVLPIVIFIAGLSGLGSALLLFIGMAVMATYFKEKYALAIGISMMGLPLGMMAYGPLTQVLLDTYGWRGTVLLLGAISFHLVACSMLVQRDLSASSANNDQYQEVSVRDEDEDEETQVDESESCAVDATNTAEQGSHSNPDLRKSKARICYESIMAAMDFAVLKDVRFILLVSGRCTAAFAFSGFVVFMVSHGQLQGLSKIQASILPTSFGVGNVIGKTLAPLLQQVGVKPSMTAWACFGTVLVSASFAAEAFVRPFAGQMIFSGLMGLGFALEYQAVDVMVRFLVNDDRLVSVLGWQGVFSGAAGTIGGLMPGWIYEWTGSFSIAFCVYGGVTLLSIPLFLCEAVYAKRMRAH
ncbi:monocarboxylate transporter 2-like [Patiria miniata]|uniref:Major facilitator superfamily (MFS) profile domain-containing protein n=1 Tax=Patiria miniata TaxID=46514 RepID=A0A913ZZR7_PATMI|nr:monocarboxylate transporter 2-like [Patiria miniata]